MPQESEPYRIAIVAAGARLPGAENPEQFWNNIVNRVDASSDVPLDRWPIDPASVFQSGGPHPDRAYSLRGYFLDSIPIDPAFATLDLSVHLLLAVGRAAWADAVTESIDRSRVGVIVGNIALPTEHISELSRELCKSLFAGREPRPTIDPTNRFAVGLPAGILAQALGLGGGSVTLDAACASSLFAIKLACDELTSGRRDAMLAGGMNRSDSLYTQMGFSQLRALSPSGRCSPLDARADGLMVGEGAVVFVLKRLEDAEAHGDRILGVIRGVGLSNDIVGGLLAPAQEGQLRAMRSAYAQADLRPSDIDLIECHATGTPVGDGVELSSLQELWSKDDSRSNRCVLSAVKANVGHLLTGAGAAGMLKVLLALKNEALPPTANFAEQPHDANLLQSPFMVLDRERKWLRRDDSMPRRAAINAFGFGGINAHVIVEEYNDRRQARESAVPKTPASPIAIVGIGSQFGTRRDQPREGFYIVDISIPLDRFRVPPAELREALPQQLLMLAVAAEAVDDAGGLLEPENTGALIGLGLDLNTTNFHFRWSQPAEQRNSAGPALNANRVMGSLGSITASRLARAFGLGGPSFTLCAEESSGLRALELAVRALERGDIRQAVVGAVELSCDRRNQLLTPREQVIGDGAAALVLMRRDDAIAAGKRIYATIDGLGVATHDPDLARERASAEATQTIDAVNHVGLAGGATALASVIEACSRGRGRFRVESQSVDGNCNCVVLSSQGMPSPKAKPPLGPSITVPVGQLQFPIPTRALPPADEANLVSDFAAAQVELAKAHEAFLRFTQSTHQHFASIMAFQNSLLERGARLPAKTSPNRAGPKPWLDRDACLELAVGKIGSVLGPTFAPIDVFPTRVRLPDEPLMLVDRMVEIEAEPLSMTHGRLVTEHDIDHSRWYLDNGCIPASIAIESGQADLFLSAYLGIDFKTRGLAVYRLLDAAVTFHRSLPGPGATVRYDIRIERFFRQGDTYLFRFRFDGTVDGEPLLTMRDGCAGFFTPEELAAGKGIVLTEIDRQPVRLAADELQACRFSPEGGIESYDSERLDALRRGDLAACFGEAFASLPVRNPLTLPRQEKLRLIDRVTRLEPRGGRFGLGFIRAEADIQPDDWFLVCHFVDDQVMPGTLMYECCLHTLRVLLLRLGWVGEANESVFEPVPGVASRLRCRGQVTATTKQVAYEISIKKLSSDPEPHAIADAMMYADGKAIVDVRDMTLRLKGVTAERLKQMWSSVSAGSEREIPQSTTPSHGESGIVFAREQVLEFATGRPSAAFGDRYRPFDRERFIARLPAPPYSFLDRVVSTSAEPWTMKAGGSAVVEYDVPRDAWYFARQQTMPYAVLNEVALQACGWISAFVGSALHGDGDLHYRNLGGTASQFAEVGPDAGTLTTRITMTKASKSAGMIIQNFEFEVAFADGRPIYRGNTYFGFFSAQSLMQQVGLREVTPYQPSQDELLRAEAFPFPTEFPFPDAMFRMVSDIDLFFLEGGPHRLGLIRGSKSVDPAEWFFKAHFHHDPVWPGSLGLESFVQLLQLFCAQKWGASETTRWQAMAHNAEHSWVYRGQVVPSDRRVAVQAEITRIQQDTRTVHANGLLLVDGRVIYGMNGFALRHLV